MKKQLGLLLLGATLLFKGASAMKESSMQHTPYCDELLEGFDVEHIIMCGTEGFEEAEDFAQNWPVGTIPLTCGCRSGSTPDRYYRLWDDVNFVFYRDQGDFTSLGAALAWYDELILGTWPGPNIFCKVLTDGETVLAYGEEGTKLPKERFYCLGEAVFEGIAAIEYTNGWVVTNGASHFLQEFTTLAAAQAAYDFLLSPKIMAHQGVIVQQQGGVSGVAGDVLTIAYLMGLGHLAKGVYGLDA